MLGRLQLWRLLGAMAVFAALSLAPQTASAHAGHSHAQPSHAQPSHAQPSHAYAAAAVTQQATPVAQDAAAQAEQQTEHIAVTQALTEADPAAPCADHGCGDRGCCSNGPCTGCHGFVVLPVPTTAPPTLSSTLRLDDPPPQLGAGGTKLRRPPKSFV